MIIPSRVKIVRLFSSRLLNASNYPIGTLFFQMLGSLIVGVEAAFKLRPILLIDTLGSACSYYPFKICGSSVAAYVHYPFISGPREKFEAKPKSFREYVKGLYKNLVFSLYRQVGATVDLCMVNSKWTLEKMAPIWNCHIELVYPPCNLKKFETTCQDKTRSKNIISLAQFRKEKNHQLQLETFALLKKCERAHDVRLIIIGGTRNTEDKERVESLKELAISLGISSSVSFVVDASFSEILQLLSNSLIGVHTMVDEHFGISVIEFLAAGLIVVAHNSGGPKTDIIQNGMNGFLANTAEEYYIAFENILKMSESKLETIRQVARGKIQKFDEDTFVIRFNELICMELNV